MVGSYLPSPTDLYYLLIYLFTYLLTSAAMLEWSDSAFGIDQGVGHTEEDSSQKPLVLGPLEARSSLSSLVAKIQVKAQEAEGERKRNTGREDAK